MYFQGDEEEEETDNLVSQVLDEIGINLDEQMVAAPGQKVQACTPLLLLSSRTASHAIRHSLELSQDIDQSSAAQWAKRQVAAVYCQVHCPLGLCRRASAQPIPLYGADSVQVLVLHQV